MKKRNKREKYALYQRPGSTVWYVSTIRRSTFTSDFATAQSRRDFIVAEMEAGKWQTRRTAQQLIFPDFAATWLQNKRASGKSENTLIAYDRAVDHLSAFFRRATLAEINDEFIEAYIRARMRAEASPATICFEIDIMSMICKHAIKKQYMLVNPCFGVEKPSVRRKGNGNPLSEEDEAKLLAYVREHMHNLLNGDLADIITMGIHTGQRRASLLSRQWEHVNFAGNELTCYNDKTDSEYITPLTHVLRAMLLRRHFEGATGLIFRSKTGKQHNGSYVLSMLRKAAIDCGIGRRKVHDLRHTLGSRLAEMGYTDHQIASVLDHSNTQTTAKYIKHSSHSKRSILANFGRKNDEIEAQICTQLAQLPQ